MDRIEKVARALCKADGFEPNDQVETNDIIAIDIGQGAVGAGARLMPQWQAYEKEAKRFIVAYDALQPNPLFKEPVLTRAEQF